MSRVFLGLLFVVLTLVIRVSAAQEGPEFPPKLKAVEKYLMQKEYPELFGDNPYHIRPTGYAIGDLDGDGVDEVVMSFYPHYLQSPTVVIFHVDDELNVVRVKEGLAPGPLMKLTGEYLNSHNQGVAVDMRMGEKEMKDPERRRAWVLIALKRGQNIVEYENFFHLDGREGDGSYIDMTHIKNMPEVDTCNGLQFSRVEHLELVKKTKTAKGKIVVDAGGARYVYTINRFLPNGLIDKSVNVTSVTNSKSF